eukprot:CAMPEP_0185613668 /NCGR_PEP_ID=MMETSP0436-20130131/28118_1 /TAXON_ID=626734 ORGANISM="Favella taraikaensis, Strain Fe Narragansett Bay" /NCGR_SAMPLE_ID=MMETSP0436 /ASSEMBLY_ACC=CAM_ASM_000390 /LENGTH=98 /DNA_ID=CAMNT_0028247853 /DNA_START=610 /DNA_END=906 /DNA_ORIENTATION=+
MSELKMDKKEYYLSAKQYCELEFMNEVPELVCDLLFYMSGYVHFRTNRFSQEGYEQILRCQLQNINVMSKEQMTNYNNDGWKHDEKGVEDRMNEYLAF